MQNELMLYQGVGYPMKCPINLQTEIKELNMQA